PNTHAQRPQSARVGPIVQPALVALSPVQRRKEMKPMNRGGIGRNDPCFCGSGKKYKHCCIHRETSGYPLESYSVRQPRQVPHDGAALRLTKASAKEGTPRSDMPAVRVGVEYVFDEPFGKAYVSYSFSVRKTIVLESGDVTWVEFLQPGMRFKLE